MKKETRVNQPWAWLSVCSRVLVAVVGGYVFTYTATAALARLLPLDRIDALTTASLLSFVVYLVFILWAFAAASLRRALTGLSLSVPMAAVGFWPQLLEIMQ